MSRHFKFLTLKHFSNLFKFGWIVTTNFVYDLEIHFFKKSRFTDDFINLIYLSINSSTFILNMIVDLFIPIFLAIWIKFSFFLRSLRSFTWISWGYLAGADISFVVTSSLNKTYIFLSFFFVFFLFQFLGCLPFLLYLFLSILFFLRCSFFWLSLIILF